MWRKLVIAGSLALMAVLSLDAGQANERKRQDQNRSGQDRDRQSRVDGPEIVRVMKLSNDVDHGQILIEAVIVSTDTRLFGTLTNMGIERDSTDKLQLGGLPIIGSLFSSKVPAGLGPEQEVGRAYSNGTTLVITLWPRVTGSDVRLEFLPNDIDALNENLRAITSSNQPPASTILPSGPAGGWGTVDSLLVANETYVYEFPRTNFQDMGVVDEGQTVMIGGLTSQTQPQKSGTPLLNNVPVLGYLFQGKTYRRETELVVIVTPSIIRAEE